MNDSVLGPSLINTMQILSESFLPARRMLGFKSEIYYLPTMSSCARISVHDDEEVSNAAECRLDASRISAGISTNRVLDSYPIPVPLLMSLD